MQGKPIRYHTVYRIDCRKSIRNRKVSDVFCIPSEVFVYERQHFVRSCGFGVRGEYGGDNKPLSLYQHFTLPDADVSFVHADRITEESERRAAVEFFNHGILRPVAAEDPRFKIFYTCFEKFILSLFMVKKCRGYNQNFSLSLFKPKKRGVYAQKIYPLTFSAKKSGS